MSNNPGNNNINKMYTSTPVRKRATNDNDNDTPELRSNQMYYSLPRAVYSNSIEMSENNEFQTLPTESYNSTTPTPELLNENELQLVIESDSEVELYTNYKTADSSLIKSNYCHPLYFENAQTIPSSSTQNESISIRYKNNDTDTDYMDIPLNLKEYYQPSTSHYTDTSTSTSSTLPNIFMGNLSVYQDIQNIRRNVKEFEESDDSDTEYPRNNDSHCGINETCNSNYIQNNQEEMCRKTVKPHISMETYPCSSSSQHVKKSRRRSPDDVIKEDDYQQIPTFLNSCDTDPSNVNSYSKEATLEPIYMKYSTKEDLSAKSDSINMLSVVISTVMLLAAKKQIPQNYITWTLKYLKCIRNKQGQYPPNIKKIQKMLTASSGTGLAQEKGQWSCMDALTGKNPGKRMDLTKKRRENN